MINQDYLSQPYLSQPYLGGVDLEEPPDERIATSLIIFPLTDFGPVGSNTQFSVIVLDQYGEIMEGEEVDWESSNEVVATVSSTGLVSYLSSGTAIITVSHGDILAQASIVSIPPSVSGGASIIYVKRGGRYIPINTPAGDE